MILNQVGDPLPKVDLYEGNPGNKVNTGEAFGKGKHVIVAVVGAFTPTCQKASENMQTKQLEKQNLITCSSSCFLPFLAHLSTKFSEWAIVTGFCPFSYAVCQHFT